MKTHTPFLSALAFAVTAICAGSAQAAMQSFTPLPTPDCGLTQTNNCITYGDFNVFSLGLLYTQATYASTGIIPTTNPNPGDPYYVASSPGELGNDGYIVYGTGTNNNNVVTNGNGTLIDDAQQQPSGSGDHPPFVVGTATETSPTFTGDTPDHWDGTLSAIRAELGAGSNPAGQFVIYFNLNETGGTTLGADGLAPIDLLAWFHVQLVDAQGVLPTKDFYLTGASGTHTAPGTSDADLASQQASGYSDWVTVHGTICVSATAGFLGYGTCTAAQLAAGGKNVNQNLGANTAAFAMFNQELSDLVLNSGYDYIRGNWELAKIDNGYEQEFSALTTVGRTVPEPGTLALLGLGLSVLGLGGLRRRKAD